MISIAALLREAGTCGVDRLDAQLLIARRLGRTRTWLIAHDDDAVPEDLATWLRADIAERARGVPLAYILGEREFHGLMLRVTPDVLVPRPDTELLVDWALELLVDPLAAIGSPSVADLGTGSGAIALAVKRACPRAQVLAVDTSEAALAVARDNASRLALDLESIRSDWLADLGARRFHLLLSNPPYIDSDDPHLAALHAEPTLALTPAGDGMAALRTIVDQAPAHLHQGGWLLLEHGHTQAAAVTQALRAGGFGQVRTRCDLAGLPRCSGGRWSANATFASG